MRLLVACFCFILAILGFWHHYWLTGLWFQWEQFWHHESLIVICFALGIGILVGLFRKEVK